MKLRVVPTSAVGYCAAWHCREEGTEPLHGARCCLCGRDVAAPDSVRGKHVGCIYCGLANGDLPLVEIEPCKGPENGLWLAGVDYNELPYGHHIEALRIA